MRINGVDYAKFQSTQPEWAATITQTKKIEKKQDFNPRSPSGLRLVVREGRTNIYLFQSTQPEWAATNSTRDGVRCY